MDRRVPRATFLSGTAILIYLGLAKLVIHLAVNGRYGIFRDELYYIICGQRLAFGFVDHPPFTPLIAQASRLLFGPSLLGLRVLPALAGAATVILAGLLARKLGGGRLAQVLAAVAVIGAPVILNFGYLLTNNAFDILFWTIAAYILAIILKDDRPRLWPTFGLAAGIAFQNKYSIVFFVAALGAGFLLSSARSRLRSGWFWTGVAVALAVSLPNLLWQWRHDLPFIELNRNAVANKNAVLSPLQFVGGQIMDALPFAFLVALIGFFYFLLAREMKPVRAFGWAYLALLVFFIFSGGKPYYLAAIYPTMLAGGAIALERWSSRPKLHWLVPVSLILIILTGAAAAPFAVPVLPVDKLVSYGQRLGITPPAGERQRMGLLPQHFADQFGWEEMAEAVARVYQGLSDAERAVCGICAQNYGEASAINIFGRRLGLPDATSGHNSYWLWGPVPGRGEVMIIIGGSADDHRQAYREVVEAARHINKYAMPYESDLPIFLCRGLKVKLQDLWPRLKKYI
ncbi:MAG: phospholipid carrier-dependent glycosyltransferase [Candidatus Aminicenantes bacterium]|nr:MAG: phospholipid carrier-dependent glycosyltransferase [Candidatus Aminicenantes bacterium]